MRQKCKWGALFLLVIGTILLVTTDNVEAENNSCTQSYIESTYGKRLKYTRNGNTIYYTGAQGLYYKTNVNNNRQDPAGDGTFTLQIPAEGYLEVRFFLSQSDEKCPLDPNKETAVITNEILAMASSRNALYDNPICVNYRNKWAGNSKMKNAVPYCFTQTTSSQYSYEEVRGWIQNAENLYNKLVNQESSIKKDEQNVDNVNVGKLTCDYYKSGNEKTYSHVETKDDGGGKNCRQTCKEVVTVKFSDPVTTQAGMCFKYLVEIKSKVECEYTYTAMPPVKQNVCIPTPECRHSNGPALTFGGPSEEFDECVKKCDNGKYSQKCIDQCFTEVYEPQKSNSKVANNTVNTFNFTNKLISNSKNNSLVKVENQSCINPRGINPNDSAMINALFEQQQKRPGGSYQLVNGRYKWVKDPNGCNSDLGSYYFRDLATTAWTVKMVNWHNNSSGQCLIYGGAGDGTGFMYLHGLVNEPCGNTASYKINANRDCSATCSLSNECDGSGAITQAAADQKYQQELDAYNKAKESCEQQNTICSTETGTYTITVENGKDTIYKATQKQNSSSIGGPNPDIVKDTSGMCMGSTAIKKNDGNDYRDLLSFAKNYINNKTGLTATNVKPEDEKFYTYIGDEFCTKLTSKSTNVDWYRWKVDKNGGALTSEEKQIIDKNTKTNINAKIEDFGYFGWSFDINCFYALIKNPKNYDPKDPIGTPSEGDKPGSGNGDSVTSDFIFRSVSLNDLFPESSKEKNGRTPRFNWNCNGTNLNNKNYPVQPVALTKNIESVGENIYNEANNNTYLDYEIVLTPSTMNKIRKGYNAKYKNYSYPKGNDSNEVATAGSKKTAGVTVYRSDFLHNFLGSGVVKKAGLIGCNNQLSETECDNRIYTENSCYNEYQSDSIR